MDVRTYMMQFELDSQATCLAGKDGIVKGEKIFGKFFFKARAPW